MSLLKIEKETIITFNEQEKEACVYTYNPSLKKQLGQLMADKPDEVKLEISDSTGAETYVLPKVWVKIRPKRKATEAQRVAALNALAMMHK